MSDIEELRKSIDALQAERDALEFSEDPNWSYRDRDLRLRITALRDKLLIAQEAQRHAY
ncbi:MAG: hypothetical protein RIS45_1562 [Planctomycetota bacterium]|jgi:hypothetical protein